MSKAKKLSGFNFARLADVRAPVTSERDLYLQQLGVLTMRHVELIGGIKALADMLQVRRPNKAQTRPSGSDSTLMLGWAFRILFRSRSWSPPQRPSMRRARSTYRRRARLPKR